jgi:hypothetical protein
VTIRATWSTSDSSFSMSSKTDKPTSDERGLNPKARDIMLRKLEEYLRGTQVGDSSMGPFAHAPLDGFAKLAHSAKKDWISKEEAYVLPVEATLRAIPTMPKEAKRSIYELLGDEKAHEMCRNVVAYIENLPHEFETFFALPSLAIPGDTTLDFAAYLSLLMAQPPPSESGTSADNLLVNALLRSGERSSVPCVRIQSSGHATPAMFAGSLSESAPRQAYARFRHFLVAGMLDGALRLGPTPYSADATAGRFALVWTKAKTGETNPVNVPHDLGHLLSRVQLTDA